MQTLSKSCPHCEGLGRIISRENLATKIERWFARARVAKKYRDFHLVVNPVLGVTLAENGIDRLERIMKAYRFKVNLIRDTTLPQQEFRIYEAAKNKDITDLYTV